MKRSNPGRAEQRMVAGARTSRRWWLPGFLILAIGTAGGCGSEPYQLAPVAGRITLDGEPLAEAHVGFQPRSSDPDIPPGPGSTAITDADGRYELATIRGEPGAIVGFHRVRIYSNARPELDSSKDSDPESMPPERVPEEYNYRSRLTFEVLAEGHDEAHFDLATKSPAAP